MPPARSATSAARSSRTAATRAAPAARSARTHPRVAPLHFPISRIKWDRAGRIVMLFVLGLVAYLGIKGMLTLLSTHSQAAQQQKIVRTLARENRRLEQLQRSLGQAATIMKDARSLGMLKAGERSYSVTGLSGR
ncbi:MAG TPA: septum formation initiator family protein [Solirubrobacteraceae bacterium]|jgi:cell division protein FtsB|nr:septum formation initiator family protein [Solirubrobacteraceae bacterium]